MAELKRRPTSPGEILREEFLKPLRMTQRELAGHLGCDIKVINRIVNARSALTAEMALKLAATFATTPDFWLNAQTAIDLYTAQRRLKRLPPALKNPSRRQGRHDDALSLHEA
jgi:addiction module HigA family antidote